MRPVRVVCVGAAGAAHVASMKAAGRPPDLGRLFLAVGAREAFLLPFWDNCIAFVVLRASFSAFFVAICSAFACAFAARSASRATRFSISIFCLYRRAASLSSFVSTF